MTAIDWQHEATAILEPRVKRLEAELQKTKLEAAEFKASYYELKEDFFRTFNHVGPGNKIVGLGHIGLYVHDLDKMTAHYRDVLGMQVTKQNQKAGIVFLSSEPKNADHEIALFKHKPSKLGIAFDGGSPIQQISIRVLSLDDLRNHYRKLVAQGYRIDQVVNHVSAIGVYYYDPEDNRSEVYWVTGRNCWFPITEPIDIEQSNEAILAEVDRHWEKWRYVEMGAEVLNEVERKIA
jgi:catechol-2,3-dioxygenase